MPACHHRNRSTRLQRFFGDLTAFLLRAETALRDRIFGGRCLGVVGRWHLPWLPLRTVPSIVALVAAYKAVFTVRLRISDGPQSRWRSSVLTARAVGVIVLGWKMELQASANLGLLDLMISTMSEFVDNRLISQYRTRYGGESLAWRKRATAVWPFLSASARAVFPSEFLIFRAAPCSTKVLTTSNLPKEAA
jgi:hypothetical protein